MKGGKHALVWTGTHGNYQTLEVHILEGVLGVPLKVVTWVFAFPGLNAPSKSLSAQSGGATGQFWWV